MKSQLMQHIPRVITTPAPVEPEILRFDAHGPRGHWHTGGYDTLGAGRSHQDFPAGVVETASQLAWSLGHLRAHAQELLVEAGCPAAAAALDPALLAAALEPRPVQRPEVGPVRKLPEVGGLHHHYERMAA